MNAPVLARPHRMPAAAPAAARDTGADGGLLARFASALGDPGQAPPAGLRAWNGSDVRHRFNVHRNSFVAGLVQALGETLPVCRQAVGAEPFDAWAVAFVRTHPPRTPVLADWGADFAPWAQANDHARATCPWLPALARLERARVVACHAADAAPLGVAVLARRAADSGALLQARLRLHPSCHVLRAGWTVVSLWAAHQGPAAPRDLAVHEQPESALVLRDDTRGGEVLVLPLHEVAADFCSTLHAGGTLGEALAGAVALAMPPEPGAADAPAFDLAGMLALLIRHGAITAWPTPGDAP